MEHENIVIEREPTMLPDVGEVVGRCAVCRQVICSGDRVIVLDGSEAMIHEDCAVFRKESLTEFLDMLGVDYYTGDAKEMAEDV